MILTSKIKDPFNWHRHFAFTPVIVSESDQTIKGKRVIIHKKAWFQFVERKLERNLSGAEKWNYRISAQQAQKHGII